MSSPQIPAKTILVRVEETTTTQRTYYAETPEQFNALNEYLEHQERRNLETLVSAIVVCVGQGPSEIRTIELKHKDSELRCLNPEAITDLKDHY
jgi:hypothetical protein